MAVKLRLQRKGRRKAPFYHIVVADSRAPRDGRFIEKIGTYNPLTVPATIELNQDAAFKWLMIGAEPTDTVNAILRFKGVLLRKHLQLGVNKGAITQEVADEKLAAWMAGKDGAITKQKEAVKEQKLARIAKMDGVAKIKAKPVEEVPAEEPATEEATEAATTEETPAADENTAEA
ncbi:MAG: 30S ribosomal protein S16 [Saprospiraceae bacterium]|nr:30S ribosomal protein S16 [Saprospiraceae bacterium]